MVALASSGLRVVRLKGGDPLIFGRAGEEIESLRRSNIPFEIVPGVTSALGAAARAQIPLTHRRASSALVLHDRSSCLRKSSFRKKMPPIGASWSPSGATLVIYMPGQDYSGYRAEVDSGRACRRDALRHHLACHHQAPANASHDGDRFASRAATRRSNAVGRRRSRGFGRSRRYGGWICGAGPAAGNDSLLPAASFQNVPLRVATPGADEELIA